METYLEFKERQQKEFGELPIVYAFNSTQFAEGMAKLGLTVDDTDKVVSTPVGGFMLKTDSEKFLDLLKRHRAEFKEAMASDTDGTGFIYQTFRYELNNYEYCITGDATDTLNALGLSMEEVKNNPIMLHAFKMAGGRIYGE